MTESYACHWPRTQRDSCPDKWLNQALDRHDFLSTWGAIESASLLAMEVGQPPITNFGHKQGHRLPRHPEPPEVPHPPDTSGHEPLPGLKTTRNVTCQDPVQVYIGPEGGHLVAILFDHQMLASWTYKPWKGETQTKGPDDLHTPIQVAAHDEPSYSYSSSMSRSSEDRARSPTDQSRKPLPRLVPFWSRQLFDLVSYSQLLDSSNSPIVRTWFTDHDEHLACYQPRQLILKRNYRAWLGDIRRLWRDRVNAFATLKITIASPQPIGSAQHFVADLIIEQRVKNGWSTVLLNVLDDIDQWQPVLSAVVVNELLTREVLLAGAMLDTECPPDTPDNICRVYHENHEMDGDHETDAISGQVWDIYVTRPALAASHQPPSEPPTDDLPPEHAAPEEEGLEDVIEEMLEEDVGWNPDDIDDESLVQLPLRPQPGLPSEEVSPQDDHLDGLAHLLQVPRDSFFKPFAQHKSSTWCYHHQYYFDLSDTDSTVSIHDNDDLISMSSENSLTHEHHWAYLFEATPVEAPEPPCVVQLSSRNQPACAPGDSGSTLDDPDSIVLHHHGTRPSHQPEWADDLLRITERIYQRRSPHESPPHVVVWYLDHSRYPYCEHGR